MLMIALLLGLPLVAALLVAVIPGASLRGGVVRMSSLAVAAISLLLAITYWRAEPQFFALDAGWSEGLDFAFTLGGVAVSLALLYFCRQIKAKEWYIPVLILLQMGLILSVEFSADHPEVSHPFYVDSFTILMALIIGVVGGLIGIHAVRYMRDYHAHAHDIPDRQPSFFFLIFLFLAAMFGIVFANHLLWLFFFWEVTTLCSFRLISYSGTEEATRNGYRALGINALGGVFFAAAIVWLTHGPGVHTWELDKLVEAGRAAALVPAVLIAVAGLTKAAQLPFSSWLLGAMVAPTPVSALLHSSTMVKAGVFILIKLAPVYHGTLAGILLALIGAATFLITSLVAINQRNAKLVLAYSTIANLGLIVMCAGVGTVETLWAAILLVLFHAVAKALLFLGVGTTEHMIGSRDIEDMEGLVYRRPVLAAVMAIGILGMFIAPFGMLLSKYTCFKAFLTMDAFPGAGIILTAILAFGSAPTLFFWSKWLGKLVTMPRREQPVTLPIPFDEALALFVLAVLTYVACALFPVADWAFVQPYTHFLVGQGLIPLGDDTTPWETVILMSVMLAGLFLLPFLFWLRPPSFSTVSGYLSGANVDGSASYRGAMGVEREVGTRGYYLTGFIDESRLIRTGLLTSLALIAIMVASATL